MALIGLADSDFPALIDGTGTVRGFAVPPGGIDSPEILAIVRRMTAALHAAGCNGSWMIFAGEEVVGTCSFRRPPENGEAEIGYGIAATRRGRGYATQAVARALDAARDLGLHAIVAETATGNFASARVLQKNGFEPTGMRDDPQDGRVQRWKKRIEPS